MTRASTCITTCASRVLHGTSTCSSTRASTCVTTHASTCITTRASTCHYTRAQLLFKNMRPGGAPILLVYTYIHTSFSKLLLTTQNSKLHKWPQILHFIYCRPSAPHLSDVSVSKQSCWLNRGVFSDQTKGMDNRTMRDDYE